MYNFSLFKIAAANIFPGFGLEVGRWWCFCIRVQG